MASESYKLLIDSTDAPPLEVLEEQVNKDEPKKLYIEGIFGQAGKVNKNGRVYNLKEMIADVNRFNEEYVDQGRAANHMNHPNTPEIDLSLVADRTVKLTIDEKTGTVYGKALVLDTPMGLIEKSLIEGGLKIGKSTRGMGQLQESLDDSGNKFNEVIGYKVVAHDSVHDPSVGAAIMDPLLEKKEWIINNDGGWMEQPFEKLEESIATLPRKQQEQYLVECWKNFLNDIKV